GALQPGQNTIEDAKRVHHRGSEQGNPPDPLIWIAKSAENDTELRFEADAQHVLRGITALRPNEPPIPNAKAAEAAPELAGKPFAATPQGPLWRTGLGLRLGDTCSKAVKLYGNPESRSPSTKDGQPLELLYYAFDWAGPDVPQVMQVVCTAEKDGQ